MKLNSIKLPHFNSAADSRSTGIKTPDRVMISMAQHGGVPCTPIVSAGDTVKTGQLIGTSDAVLSAPIHSSVTGTVTEIRKVINVFGKLHDAVIIKTFPNRELADDIKPPEIGSREDFIAAVKKSGSVGLGGAGFPTHIKFSYDRETVHIDTLVVNGAECEPYITSDYRTFMEDGDKVADGIRRVMEYLDIKRAVIGIEADKPAAISRMTELTANDDDISVMSLPSVYPQGAEKVLIYNTTGRVVGKGKLPSSVGCLVMNCSTAAFISEYLKTGIPLIQRRVTIDGNIVNKPKNLLIPIGTLLGDIISLADVRVQPDRVLFGGPMMGTAVYELDTPLIKTINAVLLFSDTRKYEQTACIRCGRCVNACPMGLVPTDLEYAYDKRDAELLKKLNVELCMNCGACSYVCPAKRALSEKNQLSKLYLRELASKYTKRG
ncbi:MAG: electron transport complex subunit RsxC [Ruminiclostridium sp.]|nr:electron transport complex subunit RsxC [Ruminiclostridium sp.]